MNFDEATDSLPSGSSVPDEAGAYRALTAFLESLIYSEPRSREAREAVGLRVMRALLTRLGNPERKLRIVHIAGSKGKGSTVLVAEAILRQAGLRTGSYTSPHLVRWTERVRIDGEEIDASTLHATLGHIRPHVEALARDDPANPPTFFEVLTAAALVLFERSAVEWVLLEAGLGGRLDSTNVVVPRVGCLTSVELEHTDRLGSSIEDIAREKAGIAKAGIPLVLGRLDDHPRAIVQQEALARGAVVLAPDSEYRARVDRTRSGPLRLTVESAWFRFRTPLASASRAFADNVAVGLIALSIAGAATTQHTLRTAKHVLPSLRLPGRCELVQSDPAVLIDAAHTGASARDLADTILRSGHSPVHLLVSVSSRRNLACLARTLATIATAVTVTRVDPGRSLPAEEVAVAFRAAEPGLTVRAMPDPTEALFSARAAVPPGGLLCVAGSVYLAGFARTRLEMAQ